MSELGAFHQVCGARCYPLYIRVGKSRRIRGLYFCIKCKTPTYATDFRMTKTESEGVDPFQTVLSV